MYPRFGPDWPTQVARDSEMSESRAQVRIFPGPGGLVDADEAHLYVVEEFAWVTSMGPHTTPLEDGWLK